jgi:metal-dependent HD superfamily phosphatase/phosphodiesterase
MIEQTSVTIRAHAAAFALMVLATSAGCASSTKVGLSNVRAGESRQPRAEKSYDVIANGDTSCERVGQSRPDPAPVRANPCPMNERGVARVAVTR